MRELRRHPRFEYPLKVACLSDFQVLEAWAENFSLSGACLILSQKIEPGKEMGIIFKLPFRKMFAVPAQVVWSKEDSQDLTSPRYKAGVQFFYLPKFCRQQIKSLQEKIAS